jgi:type IV pilus assembly protein PilM
MAQGDETSIWKKEITFRRKPKAQDLELPPVSPEPVQETSIWKKEITLRRKPKADAEDVEAPADAAWVRSRVTESVDPSVPTVPPEVAPLVLPPLMSPAETPAPPSQASSPEPDVEAAPGAPPVPAWAAARTAPATPEPVPAPEPDAGSGFDAAAVVAAAAAEQTAPTAQGAPPVAPETAVVAAPVVVSKRPSRRERRDDRARHVTHSELVGLKIGASQIAAAQVVNKGGPKVVRMARQALKRGVVVGGELREPEELATALKAFFRKNKLPRNCVRLGIANNRIGVRTFEISGIEDPQQLTNAVRFRAQETLPIPLDEAVLDHRILTDTIDKDGVRTYRVLLVVAHRELVERYVAACRKAGLKLVGIDLEAFALLRALSDPSRPPGEDAAVVCVSIGHERSTLAVSNGSVCEFTRVLAWGGGSLDAALARVLDLTPSAVVPIKHQLVLGEEGEGAGLDARHADEARRAMVAELQTFARELVASLRFYQEQPGSLGILEVLITGGASMGGGLAQELERLVGIPVRVADPLLRVKSSRGLETNGSAASMAVAVGLGIED